MNEDNEDRDRLLELIEAAGFKAFPRTEYRPESQGFGKQWVSFDCGEHRETMVCSTLLSECQGDLELTEILATALRNARIDMRRIPRRVMYFPGYRWPDGESAGKCFSDKQYIDAAQRIHHKDGEVEIDDNIGEPTVMVSRGDDNGAYVRAWVWVYDEDVEVKI